jgi:Ca2+-binding EF-hand superfamily protein
MTDLAFRKFDSDGNGHIASDEVNHILSFFFALLK